MGGRQANETYSHLGPLCPYCGYIHEPERDMYSEDYCEQECWSCGEPFKVRVYTSTSWTGMPIEDAGRTALREESET